MTGYASTPARCLLCGHAHHGLEHVWPDERGKKPQKVASGTPRRDSAAAAGTPVLPVNTTLTPRKGDRHKPGYMAGYMRSRRAEKRT